MVLTIMFLQVQEGRIQLLQIYGDQKHAQLPQDLNYWKFIF